jgi:aminopeptidase N
MKRFALSGFYVFLALWLFAQGNPQPGAYQATAEKINDLVHTKLDARFDYSKSQLNGKAWISLRPHFYPTDSLSLDAKGMDIHRVALVKNGKNLPLTYRYDGMNLRIALDRTYRNNETYTDYIDYTARPSGLIK